MATFGLQLPPITQLGTQALSDHVAGLRRGLDASSWDDAAGWPQDTAIDKQRIADQ
jgi:hypothetical protein